MRYRLMATYRGVPYEVGVGPSNSEVVLFAACPPPEELGFEPATGHWRKPVIRAEIDALWESRPVGIFRGEPCIVLDDPGDRLHIAYLGTDAERATSLGYWQVDRGVFELLAPRDEVAELTEERVEKPLRWGELAEATGPMATYPYGSAPWPTAAPPAPAPGAADADETDPGAGGPPGETGAAEAPAAEIPPAEAPPAEAPPAEIPMAENPPDEAAAAEIPAAEAPPAGAAAAGAAGAPPAEVVAAGNPPDEAAAAEAPPAQVAAAGNPPAGAPAAGGPPAEVVAAETPLADARAAAARPADAPAVGVPPDDAPAAGLPVATVPRAKARVSDTPLADALLAETRRAARMADPPLASVPLAAPLADDPMAGRPAGAPLASVPSASVSPETVTAAAVPVPSAVSVSAEDSAETATGSWPAYSGAGTDPYPDPLPAGDALSYPDEDDDSLGLPVPPGFYDPPDAALAGIAPMGDAGGRAARRQRVPTREIFCELADLASIPRAAYALETETDGAICLLPTPDGFEVFIAADGARHELRSFAEEEAAYFYLFGVLAADAVRSGALAPTVTMANPHSGTA